MAKTGPQKYPGASTAYWHQKTWGGSAMESNVVVWHTTEGTSVPSYNGGREAPNFTAAPDFKAKKLRWYQHFDFDTSSRALVNKSGGVETNTLNAVQVELVGTCDPNTHKRWGSTPHLYSAELPDWVVRDLAAFAKWAHDQHGVPLTARPVWLAYGKDSRRPGVSPASYGASPARMSFAEWNGFKGHCGHQHVPENDHGDPGAFPMAAILAVTKGGTPTTTTKATPSTSGELDMTPEQVHAAVWGRDAIPSPTTVSTHKTNPTWKASSYLPELVDRISRLTDKVDALTKAVTELKKGA
ncbi:hypothetical protein [Streptomyces sp. NPDC046821]|uniref:hypothetical protein n=1 Tax=Streptomyces sp. NPDC046821 TaxID=3154702 RepID=UPI0033EF9EB5